MTGHLPPPIFSNEVKSLAASQCRTVQRFATDAPIIVLSALNIRGNIAHVALRVGGFSAEDVQILPERLRGTLIIKIDSGPAVGLYRFDSDMANNRFMISDLSKGKHRLLYALHNSDGIVAYGQECFSIH